MCGLVVLSFPEMQVQEQENVWYKAVNLVLIVGPWKCLWYFQWRSGTQVEDLSE